MSLLEEIRVKEACWADVLGETARYEVITSKNGEIS